MPKPSTVLASTRRWFLQSSVGAGVILFTSAEGRAQTQPLHPASASPAANPARQTASAHPLPTAAWINFEYAITWERVDLLQEMVTGLVGSGVTEITLMLSSDGGDIAAAISTYTFLTSVGIKLTTYNVGNVYSAAVVLFLAGERRVADRATQFVIHPPSVMVTAGTTTLDDLEVRRNSLEHESKRMREVILARTRLTPAQLDPMLQKPTFIEADAALGYGLATEVGHLTRPPNAQLLTLSVPGRSYIPTP